MKKIVLLDPSLASLNIGDSIIMISIEKGIQSIINGNFVVHLPTQTPIMHFYQKNDARLKLISQADFKFICGSNLFWQNMFSLHPNWNINLLNYLPIKDSVLVGVGSGIEKNNMNYYTQKLYNKVLSHELIHSVRDDITKQHLVNLGFKAINTGCATLWGLTDQVCNKIPKKKSKNVVFTLTDYALDKEKDKLMIDILKKNYEKLYFWPQGYSDYEYFLEINDSPEINIINPNLETFSILLKNNEIDYVGTRLHGGIFAMQMMCRAIIVIIDNRARDMQVTYNLNCIERTNIDNLENLLNSEIETKININNKNINNWINQF